MSYARNKELTQEIKKSIYNSVLCWLATVSPENVPNVSPKEVFNYYGTDKIIIAKIDSPELVKNINQFENVCLSFIDIWVQKGFQVKGKARIVTKSDSEFSKKGKVLSKMTVENYPFDSITEITLKKVKLIIAPNYILNPETREQEQIESAKNTYVFILETNL
jgi:uncharacterized protein